MWRANLSWIAIWIVEDIRINYSCRWHDESTIYIYIGICTMRIYHEIDVWAYIVCLIWILRRLRWYLRIMRQCRFWVISSRPMNLTMSDHWLLITVWIRRTINYCLSVPDNARLCAKSDSLLGQNVHPRPSRRNLEQPHRHRPTCRSVVHLKHYRSRHHGRLTGHRMASN